MWETKSTISGKYDQEVIEIEIEINKGRCRAKSEAKEKSEEQGKAWRHKGDDQDKVKGKENKIIR